MLIPETNKHWSRTEAFEMIARTVLGDHPLRDDRNDLIQFGTKSAWDYEHCIQVKGIFARQGYRVKGVTLHLRVGHGNTESVRVMVKKGRLDLQKLRMTYNKLRRIARDIMEEQRITDERTLAWMNEGRELDARINAVNARAEKEAWCGMTPSKEPRLFHLNINVKHEDAEKLYELVQIIRQHAPWAIQDRMTREEHEKMWEETRQRAQENKEEVAA